MTTAYFDSIPASTYAEEQFAELNKAYYDRYVEHRVRGYTAYQSPVARRRRRLRSESPWLRRDYRDSKRGGKRPSPWAGGYHKGPIAEKPCYY